MVQFILLGLIVPTLLFAATPEEEETVFWNAAAIGAFEIENSLSDLSEWPTNNSFSIEIPLKTLASLEPGKILHCTGTIGGLKTDFAISCAFFHKLQPTEEEFQRERIDLIRHLQELIPSVGQKLSLLTYQNGIKTSLSLFLDSCDAIAKRIPEGTLFIGLYNKTRGLAQDILRLLKEISCFDTPAVVKTRLFFQEIGSQIHAINPNMLWGCILHSEAGALARRAIEGLPLKERGKLQKNLYLFAMTPVLPIPENYGYYTLNLYSKYDFLSVGGYLFGIGGRNLANTLFGAQNCRMQFIPCSSNWDERTFLFIDHSFLGTTYLQALEEQIARWRSRYGLYDGH